MTITGRRTKDEERAFKAACAERLLSFGPAKERVVDAYTGQVLYVTPTTQTCPEETCIDGWIYDVRHGLIVCPTCGGGICPTCGDKGMVVPDLPVTDPDFGKAQFCPRPGCKVAAALIQERAARLYAGSKLPPGYQNCTLESFLALVQSDDAPAGHERWRGKLLAFEAVAAFIANAGNETLPFGVDYAAIVEAAAGDDAESAVKTLLYGDVRNSLVLYGPHGTGKTGFLAAIANAAAALSVVSRYTRAQNMMLGIQRRYAANWRDSDVVDEFGDMESAEIINSLKEVPLLLLDEMDMPDADTPNKLGIMENIIRHRMGHRKPTVISSNLNYAALEGRWGTTTMVVLGERAHFIAVGGPVLRAVPQAVQGVL